MNLQSLLQSWRDAMARSKAPTVLVALEDQRLRIQPLGGGVDLDVPLPLGLCRAGLPSQIEALGDFIGDLLVEQGWVNAVVMAALPFEGAVLRVLEPPENEGVERIPQLLKAQEAMLRLPFALEEADLDLQRLDSPAGRWLMVAARQQLVEAWLRVFDLAGAQFKRLEPVQLCWLAVVEAVAPAGTAVVVEAVADGYALFVAMDQQPVYEAALLGPAEAWPEQILQVVQGLTERGCVAGPRGLLLSPELPVAPWEQLSMPVLQRSDPYASLALAGLAQLA